VALVSGSGPARTGMSGHSQGGWIVPLAAALRARKAPWGGLVAPLFVPDSLAWTFMRSLRDFDPMAAPSRLRMPTLVVLGDRDDEEPWKRSRALWEEAFRAAGNREGRIVVLPGAAHSEAIRRWLAGLRVIRAQTPPSRRPSSSPITVATSRLVRVPTR